MKKRGFLFFLLAKTLVISASLAQPTTQFSIEVDEKSYICQNNGNTWVPGTYTSAGDFQSFRIFIAKLKKKIKTASGTKSLSLKNKVKKLTKKSREVQAVCEINKPVDTGMPTPVIPTSIAVSTVTPTRIPGAVATATPQSAASSFTASGDVTLAGKNLFAIPPSLSGNITRGKAEFQNNCSGCHTEQRAVNKTFTYLRTAIKITPMLFNEGNMPDAQLADITAYLNRFR
jgi:hypothetical protein